ncbi:MAG: M42 family peptidase [Oscillospiraceae bacterium]|nr:M42 family peptidase [Oscillospiraceae bacterium]
MTTFELVKNLCEIDGVSGAEDKVRDYIEAQVKDYCDCRVDARGNLICFKKGKQTPSKKIMLSAHMDEVGFVVTGVDSEGFLRFSTVGGIDSRVVIGKRVRLESGIPAIVGTKPIHMQSADEQNTPLKISDMYLDIGAKDKEDALTAVELGDHAAFFSNTVLFGNDRIKAKALDDRAGCACLIQLLQQEADYDFTACFTVCEECGKSGADNAAYSVQPDIAIVVECTTAADVHGVSELDQVVNQGQGPALSFMDKGCIYDKALFKKGLAIAKEHNVPCQVKRAVAGGNDSAVIQTMGPGVKVMAVSMPGRYIHSASSVLKLSDIDATTQLLGHLVKDLAQ